MGSRIYRFIFIVCLAAFLTRNALGNIDLFFPYGLAEGDDFLLANDDRSTEEIPLAVRFPFFDHDHQSLFVNNNGAISFLEKVSSYSPDSFPLGSGLRLIAPFWADIDTRTAGNLSYREVLRFDQNEAIFQEADNIIRNAFASRRRFTSSWLFIATWDRVPYYGASTIFNRNSFQVVLATDGRYSFAVFNYGDITWTTGTASGGNSSSGLGGTPAQVGFNAGDGINFYSVQGSQTDAIVDIEETSNIGQPGRWVFRTDSSTIEGLMCTASGEISLFPLVGSMLGGTQVLITGPCFNSSSEILCDFDGVRIPGKLISYTSALCVTPTFFKVGDIPLEVSLDGGSSFNFRGTFFILNVEDVPVHVQTSAIAATNKVTEMNITWSPGNLDFVDRVSVIIYGYRETSSEIEFIPILTLAQDVDFSLGYHYTTMPSTTGISHDVAVIGIVDSSDSVGNSVQPAALWSTVHVLQWLRGHDSDSWCKAWLNQESQINMDFLDVTAACPCTLEQALFDIGRFSPHPECDIDSSSPSNCQHNPGAVHCVRANTPSELGGGQVCCYDAAGTIINVALSSGGGHSHRRHHEGVAPYAEPTKVPHLSHFLADILPWTYCCWIRKLDSANGITDGCDLCDMYGDLRPSHICNDYVPPSAALGNGVPHIATLDSTTYTFNGHGEFTLLSTLDNEFVLQARTEPLPGVRATVFVAIAAKFGESDVIHVQTNERRVLNAYVKSANGSGYTRVDFEQAIRWTFKGVVLDGRNISSNGIFVIFNEGVGLQVNASEGAMSILLVVPDSFRGRTRGLMGTWNGDPSDDFLTPTGITLSSNLSTEELHYQFGLQWEIKANESLFFYPTGTDHETNTNRSYVPVFEPAINPNVNQSLLIEVCGTNLFCIFDFQATGSESFAQASVRTFAQYEAAEASSNFVACPRLVAPVNGSVTVSGYIEGGVAMFACDDGFNISHEVILTCQPSGIWSNGKIPKCTLPTQISVSGLPTWAIITIVAVVILTTIAVIVGIVRKCSRNESPARTEPDKPEISLVMIEGAKVGMQ